MRLCVIPARGGSKRIPRKNIRPFAGRPMIGYAIAAAKATGLFDRIIVSTDDSEIAEIAVHQGAEVPFDRPPELADDHTPTVPVIAHAIQACAELGWHAHQICCLYPCVPLIDEADIEQAHTMLEEGGAPYVMPVAAFPTAIQRALRRDLTGRLSPFDARYEIVRSQDLEPAFFDAGQFYWGTADAWSSGLSVHSNAASIVLPEWKVIDIDTPADWRRAELLFRALHNPDGMPG